jgi:hypothetical protein
MAQKQLRSDLLQVKATFIYHGDQVFRGGQIIAGDHPVVRGRGHLFRAFVPVGAPAATPEPGPEPESQPEPTTTPEPEPTP